IDDDINESIQLAEQLRDITFIKIPRIKFEEKIILVDEDLENYYDLNKASFTSPEKAKITYTVLDSEDIKEDILISDEEIDSEYQDYFNNFDRTQRKSVSHIMLNIDDSRTSDVALQEIEKIKNEFDTGKSFEELALEHSEDGGTKDLGGSLGITDGTLLPPEFEEALQDMVVGETRSIELMTSIHLLKLDEIIQPEPESIEERSEQIIDTLTNIKAEELYVELLDEVSNMAFTSSDIQNISKDLDLDVVETDFVAKNELPESLQSQNLIDYIFQDSFESNFPEIIELSELSAVLIQVTDYLEEKQLSFQEVKSQIQNVYLAEETMKASKEFGENSVSELQNGLEISELSIQLGQTLENYKGIKRDSSLLPIQAVNQIFTLPKSKSGEAFGYSIAQNGDTFIFRLDDVTPGSVSVTDEEKQSIKDFLSQQKITSELAELQVYLEDSLSVQKLN
ncbi:MAG: peptidyl-prolyl cis-trans isomerase, partial [Pseudomonadota bacterium]|nr:peptidyl-prolyl cis-trans isomerase [Pseudomonadota bacterium]